MIHVDLKGIDYSWLVGWLVGYNLIALSIQFGLYHVFLAIICCTNLHF